jgi:hypothetical protein
VIVRVPAPVSVTVVRDEPLLPFIIATNNNITITPATTQTHGIVYHSLCSVVVVVTVLLVELSWLQQIMLKQFNNTVTKKYLKKLVADKFFIVILLVKKTLSKTIYSTITPNENPPQHA